jgi:hypothetical protein
MADLTGLPADLRGVIERAITPTDDLSDQMEAGDIGVDAWRDGMADIIRQFMQEALNAGADTTDTDAFQPLIDSLVNIQLAFLDNFAADIQANGWLPAYRSRAQMYDRAVSQAYWNGNVFEQAGRVLPLPAMPAEGTQCLSNCKCSWRIVVVNAAAGDFDAFWERNVEDSCQTCLGREALWSPIRIRGGELQ